MNVLLLLELDGLVSFYRQQAGELELCRYRGEESLRLASHAGKMDTVWEYFEDVCAIDNWRDIELVYMTTGRDWRTASELLDWPDAQGARLTYRNIASFLPALMAGMEDMREGATVGWGKSAWRIREQAFVAEDVPGPRDIELATGTLAQKALPYLLGQGGAQALAMATGQKKLEDEIDRLKQENADLLGKLENSLNDSNRLRESVQSLNEQKEALLEEQKVLHTPGLERAIRDMTTPEARDACAWWTGCLPMLAEMRTSVKLLDALSSSHVSKSDLQQLEQFKYRSPLFQGPFAWREYASPLNTHLEKIQTLLQAYLVDSDIVHKIIGYADDIVAVFREENSTTTYYRKGTSAPTYITQIGQILGFPVKPPRKEPTSSLWGSIDYEELFSSSSTREQENAVELGPAVISTGVKDLLMAFYQQLFEDENAQVFRMTLPLVMAG